MIREKLAWHKSSIVLGFVSNPMAFATANYCKLSIAFGLSSNPMVFEKLAWHKSYIHIQFQPNPM